MVDFSQLFGTTDPNMGGLLSPAQQGDVNQTTLQSIAAGLMKASGPSPYKPGMTALSGIGDALQGGIAARNAAQTAALNQSLVRAKTLEGLAPLLKIQQEYQAVGIPLPPNYQRVIDSLTSVTTGGRMGSGVPGAPGAAGAPGAPGVAPGMTAPAPQNAILKAADELGINRGNLIPGMPGYETAMARIGEHMKANDPALDAAARRKAISDAEVARDAKLYPVFASMGTSGDQMKRNAQLSQALIADPNFTSGALQPFSEAWQGLKAALGGDPKLAFSQQAFNKVTAQNINDQIGEMKSMSAEMGGAAGRIFQSQIGLMQKASANLASTPETNKFLANMYERNADNMIKVSDMATQYKKEHGILDTGFDEKLSKFMKENPLYSDDELKAVRKGNFNPTGQPPPAEAPAIAAPAGASKEVYKNGVLIGHVVGNAFVPVQTQQAAVPGPAPIPGPGQ
jgi:hypothetical protein